MDNLFNLMEMYRREDYEDNLVICRAIRLFAVGDRVEWTVDASRLTERVTEPLIRKLRAGNLITSKCLMAHFEGGPKYLSMTTRQFEALEMTDLTLPIAEFQSPFETVCFPIPRDYASDREVEMLGEARIPKYAILHRESGMLMVTIVYARDFLWSVALIPRHPEETFEDKLHRIVVGELLPGSGAQLDVLRRISRACLNGCLVFDQVKTTCFRTEGSKRLRTKTSVYYSFDQSVRLHSCDRESGEGTGEGSERRCHWRRGHWRQQPHGPGNSLRRRVRIAPVLVRRDLFAGELRDARATYETA